MAGVVLGMQVFALGLLGELIIFTHARDIKDYQIEEVVRYPGLPPAAGLPQPQLQPVPGESQPHVAPS